MKLCMKYQGSFISLGLEGVGENKENKTCKKLQHFFDKNLWIYLFLLDKSIFSLVMDYQVKFNTRFSAKRLRRIKSKFSYFLFEHHLT